MTDPVTLAREVVDDYESMDDWNKPRTRSGKEVPPSRVTLARAVLDLTAKAERVPALADALEKVLNLHVKAQPIPAAYGTQEGGNYCVTCAEDWPCATFTTITTALEAIK